MSFILIVLLLTTTFIYNRIFRYYVKCISSLQYSTTIELFHAQARAAVAAGLLTPPSEMVFELAALRLQQLDGDFNE